MQRVYFITGTDTAVGKTVLTALLTRYLHQKNGSVIAFKPLCSGGRADAQALHRALEKTIPLDIINPWHFKLPLAPVLAARREKKQITLAQTLAHLGKNSKHYQTILIEGAGGLLSPLGEDFNSRDLITKLRARPIIVAPNKLGVINHLRLTLAALPQNLRSKTQIILMSSPKINLVATSNLALLRELLPTTPIHAFPWLGKKFDPATALKQPSVRQVLDSLTQ